MTPHQEYRSLRTAAAVAVILVLVSAIGLIGGTAGAAVSTTAPAATVPVMIVLDASGSMNQTDAPGPLIDAAKAAITNLIDTLPAGTQVGLQVYGTGTGSTDAEKAAGCADIKTLAPVAQLDAAALKSQVAGVVAAGYTPIGSALRAAAEALPTEGPRSIVLVSDGEDTCAPPTPCDVAGELHQQGIDLTIHTVGFKVDSVAREQLSCIAQATGGTYSDAADATQLSQALATKVDYAISGYTTAGTPITGLDQPLTTAPLLTPGQYVDTYDRGGVGGIDAAGTSKYYTIPVRDGLRPYISVTVVPPDASANSVELFGVDADLLNIDGSTCESERGAVILTRGRNTTATAVLDGPTFGDPKANSSCPTEGLALLQVTRIGAAWADIALPVEIVVRMEPPADASGVLPPASKGAALPAVGHGTPVGLTGGHSFNDAPQLTSGATYTDTVTTGESKFYRVPLAWGQRFTFLVSEVGPAQPPLGVVGTTVWLDVFNPVRADISGTIDNGGSSWFAKDAGEPFANSSPYPVRYTNRDGNDQDGYSLDGDYYFRVNANRSDDEPSSTTFLITVLVSGEVEPGPVYELAGAGETTGAESTTATTTSGGPTTPRSPTAGSTQSAAAGSAETSDTATTPTGQATPTSGPAVPWWVWAVVALLAVGIALAVLLARAGRSRALPSSTNEDGQPGGSHR